MTNVIQFPVMGKVICFDRDCREQGCPEHPSHDGSDHTYEQHHDPSDHIGKETCRCNVYQPTEEDLAEIDDYCLDDLYFPLDDDDDPSWTYTPESNGIDDFNQFDPYDKEYDLP